MKKLLFLAFILMGFIAISQNWQPLPAGGTDAPIKCILEDTANNALYIGGGFNLAGGVIVAKTAVSYGGMWNRLPYIALTPQSTTRKLILYNGDLYAGGDADYLTGGLSTNIAKWDGSAWSEILIGSIGTQALAMEVYNNKLYSALSPYSPGAAILREWDGLSVTFIAGFTSGGTGRIYDMTVYNGELIVCGSFTGADGVTVKNIAKWNGITWTPVGTAGTTGIIHTVTVYNGDLYAGGSFTTIDGVSANYTAKWNGSVWSAIGIGVNGAVYDMYELNGDLYLCGSFTQADGQTANYIAKWNGTNFSPVSIGMNAGVTAIGSYNGELIAVGDFTQADGQFVSYIAKFGFTPPTADFSANDTFICEGNLVTFTDLSVDTPTIWSWTFSGGTPGTSTNQNPTVTYNTPGTYNVKLVVSNVGGSDSMTKSGYITVNSLPVANAGSDVDICIGSNTNLSASGGTIYSWSPPTGLNNPNISNPIASPTSSTTYTVTVTDGNGCSDIDGVIVTVNPLPAISFSGLDSTYCDTSSAVTLTGSPSGGTFSGTGITGNQFDPSIAGIGTHTITYDYTDGNSCSNSTNQIVNVVECSIVSIQEHKLLENISIYPNPSNGKIQIQGYTGEFTVYSSLGVEVLKGRSGFTDVSGLKRGVYFLHIGNISKGIIVK